MCVFCLSTDLQQVSIAQAILFGLWVPIGQYPADNTLKTNEFSYRPFTTTTTATIIIIF